MKQLGFYDHKEDEMNYIIRTNNRHPLFDKFMDHVKRLDNEFYMKKCVFYDVDCIIYFLNKFFKCTNEEATSVIEKYNLTELTYEEWDNMKKVKGEYPELIKLPEDAFDNCTHIKLENKMSTETIKARQDAAIDLAAGLLKSIIAKYNMNDDDVEALSDITHELYGKGFNDAMEELENKLLNK